MSTLTDEDGLVKEIKVLHALRAYGAVVQTSYHADYYRKDDYRIVGLRGSRSRLRYHSLVQITRKLEDIGKLKKWLDSRRENNSINLYVQVETGVKPEKIANIILERSTRLVPGEYVLYIPFRGVETLLSPQKRIAEIMNKLHIIRASCPTMTGAIEIIRDCEVVIKARTGQTYLAYDADIKDTRLFRLILDMRRSRTGVSVPPVKFLATNQGRPHLRAHDVALNVPAEAAVINFQPPTLPPKSLPSPKLVSPSLSESLETRGRKRRCQSKIVEQDVLPPGYLKGSICFLEEAGFIIEVKDDKRFFWAYYKELADEEIKNRLKDIQKIGRKHPPHAFRRIIFKEGLQLESSKLFKATEVKHQ